MLKVITSFLLGARLVSLVSGFPWPGAQKTHEAGNTANWSPAPTTRRDKGLDLLKRDVFPVSVCGWIGAQVASPAYCSTSSSCVWNSDYSVVGCCAIASQHCAFYTSCVDLNSPTQSGDKDDVYTCRGTSLCYLNTYPSNYHQWGCGDKSWATTVATSYPGQAPDLSLQIVFTGAVAPTQPPVVNTATLPPTTIVVTSIESPAGQSSPSAVAPTTSAGPQAPSPSPSPSPSAVISTTQIASQDTKPSPSAVASTAPNESQTPPALSSAVTLVESTINPTIGTASNNGMPGVSTVIIISSASSSPENNSSSGTNIAALAGGIGGGVGGALAIGILFGVCLRRRRRPPPVESYGQTNTNYFRDSKSQTTAPASPMWSMASELDARNWRVSELP